MSANDGTMRLLRLEGSLENRLFGDIEQAGKLVRIDESHFSFEKFQPLRTEDRSDASINEIIQHQTSDFFASGYSKSVPDGTNFQIVPGDTFTIELPTDVPNIERVR
ncbi:hypothetical protein FQZ97_724740 [compost metagenome]